jgi:hypothetical protein
LTWVHSSSGSGLILFNMVDFDQFILSARQ